MDAKRTPVSMKAYRATRFGRASTSVGMDPVNLLPSRNKRVSDLVLPNSVGMVPVSWFPVRVRVETTFISVSERGMVPVSLFKPTVLKKSKHNKIEKGKKKKYHSQLTSNSDSEVGQRYPRWFR